jgi:hypothetical protein
VAVGASGQSNPALSEEFKAMRSALCDKPADFIGEGCKVCPAFMVKGEDGLPVRLRGGLEINGVLFGSFTSVGKTEAFLSSIGCFSHAAGFVSAFLLRKQQGSWRRLSFFHPDGPQGCGWKIPGQSETPDSLLCAHEDYGAGAISVIAFDADGKVKTQSVLVQTWLYPGFRSDEKQKHCSTLDAKVKNVSFDSIEISIFLNSFDAAPPINCFDESDSTTSKISNSKKIEHTAVFTRIGDHFAPDETTKKLLSEAERSR